MSRHNEHEIKAHGISPAGQAVADPDAPPSSPAGDVDPRISNWLLIEKMGNVIDVQPFSLASEIK